MRHLIRLARKAIAYSLYYTGLLWLYAGIRLRRRAVVLMYHRVLPPGADTYSHAGIVVSPATFERQLIFLARKFRLLTTDQFRAELDASAFGRRACLVTFDDGWADTCHYALPLLTKYRVPAAVFVATAYVGTGETFWQEQLTRLLCLANAHRDRCSAILKEIGFRAGTTMDAGSNRTLARAFVTTLKQRNPSAARQAIQRLREALHGVPESRSFGIDRFMTWDEVRNLARSGLVTIGSHAHSHTPLTALGYKGACQEFTLSRQELSAHGITEVTACAYPNGDVDDPVEAAATDTGFTLGFATKSGLVRHSSEAMHLRRINIHEADAASPAELLYRMLGLP